MTRDQATRGYHILGREVTVPKPAAGLYVVATPIGNLKDISIRALETLAGVDAIACEDTRVTRKLLDHYGIRVPLTPYHDHNAESARPRLLERIAAGEAIALVSDAGTPLVSDPGYKLVRQAREAGLSVTSIPGATSVIAALTNAGLPTDRFFFDGFLPAKSAQRQRRIGELARIPATLVLLESGPRLAGTLAALAEEFGAREAAVCREMTKLHEETRRGPLDFLARHYAEGGETRGEIVIVVHPPRQDEALPDAEQLDAMIVAGLASGSVKDVASEIAEMTGLPRRDVYRRALALAKAR